MITTIVNGIMIDAKVSLKYISLNVDTIVTKKKKSKDYREAHLAVTRLV